MPIPLILRDRPDSPFVVFHGRQPEAPPVEFTGNLVLTNSDPIDIRKITLQLEGIQKVSYAPPVPVVSVVR